MKQVKGLLLTVIIVSVISCSNKNALAFNEKLVGIQHELMNKVTKMQADTADATSKLTTVRDFAKLKQDEVKALQAPGGGEDFKEAMLKDLDGIVQSYNVLIKITQAGNDEIKLAPLREEFAGWEKKIKQLDENVETEQRKFAKASHITLK
jgi:hypothetical protein